MDYDKLLFLWITTIIANCDGQTQTSDGQIIFTKGVDVELMCNVSWRPGLTGQYIQWMFKTESAREWAFIASDASEQWAGNSSILSRSVTLVLRNAAEEDTGLYSCQLTEVSGKRSKTLLGETALKFASDNLSSMEDMTRITLSEATKELNTRLTITLTQHFEKPHGDEGAANCEFKVHVRLSSKTVEKSICGRDSRNWQKWDIGTRVFERGTFRNRFLSGSQGANIMVTEGYIPENGTTKLQWRRPDKSVVEIPPPQGNNFHYTIDSLDYRKHNGRHTFHFSSKSNEILFRANFYIRVDLKTGVNMTDASHHDLALNEKLDEICVVSGNPPPTVLVTFTEGTPEAHPVILNFEERDVKGTPIKKIFLNSVLNLSGIIRCSAWQGGKNRNYEEKTKIVCLYDPDQPFSVLGPTTDVPENQKLHLECRVPYCSCSDDVNWYHNGTKIKETSNKRGTYFHTSMVEVPAISGAHTGNYTCTVSKLKARGHSQDCGSRSANVTIIVPGPPKSVTLAETSEGVECKYTSYPPTKVNLFFTPCDPNKEITQCPGEKRLIEKEELPAKDKQEVYKAVPVNQSGIYFCSVANDHGKSEARLRVCYTGLSPIIEIEGPKQELAPGQKFEISCILPDCYYETPVYFLRRQNGEENFRSFEPSSFRLDRRNQDAIHVYTLQTSLKDHGSFKCVAKRRISVRNGNENQESELKLVYMKAKPTQAPTEPDSFPIIISSSIAALFLLIAMIIGGAFFYKHRQYARVRKQLAEDFKKGKLDEIDPTMSVLEQARKLPLEKKWEFPRDRLLLGPALGEGFFGVVYQGEAIGILPNEDKTKVAVKTVKGDCRESDIDSLESEVKILANLGRHPHIIRLLGVVLEYLRDNELFAIMEYCSNGDLKGYLVNRRRQFINNWKNRGGDIYETPISMPKDRIYMNEPSLDSYALVAWAFQISRGMEWLSENNLYHGDLAARNILLTDQNVAKIADFGLAKNMHNEDEAQTKGQVPVKWAAVEVVLQRGFTIQSDVWSFGIVLWEIFSLGRDPYQGIESAQIAKVLNGGYRMLKPEHAPSEIFEIMTNCWNEEPEDRPTFQELSVAFEGYLDDTYRTLYCKLEAECTLENKEVGPSLLETLAREAKENFYSSPPEHIALTTFTQARDNVRLMLEARTRL